MAPLPYPVPLSTVDHDCSKRRLNRYVSSLTDRAPQGGPAEWTRTWGPTGPSDRPRIRTRTWANHGAGELPGAPAIWPRRWASSDPHGEGEPLLLHLLLLLDVLLHLLQLRLSVFPADRGWRWGTHTRPLNAPRERDTPRPYTYRRAQWSMENSGVHHSTLWDSGVHHSTLRDSGVHHSTLWDSGVDQSTGGVTFLLYGRLHLITFVSL